ncbi:MAG: CinA family protein [Devosia sp.]
MMFHTGIIAKAGVINHTLEARKQMIVTVESCTGGLMAGALTDVPGSSAAVFGGYVTYANQAKARMVGVDPQLVDKHGAVSEQVARAMAEGALRTSGAAVAIAVTGIAGPGGATEGKPVGLVHFAFAEAGRTLHVKREFGDQGRQAVREASVVQALDLVLEGLGAKA